MQPMEPAKTANGVPRQAAQAHRGGWRSSLTSLLESPAFVIILSLLTLYSLFGDDIRILAATPDQDVVFLVLTSITLAAFLLEMGLQIICKDGYLGLPRCCFQPFPRVSDEDSTALLDLPPRRSDSIVRISANANAEQPPLSHHGGGQVHALHLEPATSTPVERKVRRCLAWCSYAKALTGYVSIGSFYLWLDLVSTISVALEIPLLLGRFSVTSDTSQAIISLARAGRASRAGARIGRLLQLLRGYQLVSVARVARESAGSSTAATVATAETRVGSQLTDLMTRRVIIGVLLGIFIIPPLSSYIHQDSAGSTIALLCHTQLLAVASAQFALTTYPTVDWGTASAGSVVPLLGTYVYSGEYSSPPAPTAGTAFLDATITMALTAADVVSLRFDEEDISLGPLPPRKSEVEHFIRSSWLSGVVACLTNPPTGDTRDVLAYASSDTPCPQVAGGVLTLTVVELTSAAPQARNVVTSALFSTRGAAEEAAAWALGLTTLVIVVLAVGAALFSFDINRIVLRPLEYMINVVRQVSDNPLAKMPELEFERQQASTSLGAAMGQGSRKAASSKEMHMLLRTLLNIGSLLRMAFGDTGARIITSRLNSAKELNPVVPGERINGVFVYVRMHKLTELTAALHEESILLFNAIAEVVHTVAVYHTGIVAKNTNKGFLLMWQLPSTCTDPAVWNARADGALAAAIGAVCELSRKTGEVLGDGSKISLAGRVRLAALLPDLNLADVVTVACHAGWALEAPLGSDRKLDAAWISPHISVTRDLCGVLDLFQNGVGSSTAPVKIVVTHTLYALLSPASRSILWWANRVELVDESRYGYPGFEAWAVPGELPSIEEGRKLAREMRHGRTGSATAAAAIAALAAQAAPATASSSHSTPRVGSADAADVSVVSFDFETFTGLADGEVLPRRTSSGCSRGGRGGGGGSRLDPHSITFEGASGRLAVAHLAALPSVQLQMAFLNESCTRSHDEPVDVYAVDLPRSTLESLRHGEAIDLHFASSKQARRWVDAGAKLFVTERGRNRSRKQPLVASARISPERPEHSAAAAGLSLGLDHSSANAQTVSGATASSSARYGRRLDDVPFRALTQAALAPATTLGVKAPIKVVIPATLHSALAWNRIMLFEFIAHSGIAAAAKRALQVHMLATKWPALRDESEFPGCALDAKVVSRAQIEAYLLSNPSSFVRAVLQLLETASPPSNIKINN